jgi:UDP-glucuronate decarboxylase
MKSILVTGASGFLGSYLVEHHLQAGDKVYGVDNFCSSNPFSKHHRALVDNSNYIFTKQDIASKDFVESHSGTSFDVIYNFACPASPPRYQEIPIETMMTCVVGTHNVLTLAGKNTVFIQASTSEVYGDPTVHPQPESYRGYVNSYGPRSCYDEGKRAAEALCFDHMQKNGIDARLVRIFNTYGPRMDPYDGRVVTNLVGQALAGETMTLYGDGTQTRSFCYVSDLIGGILSLASLPGNPNTPVNIGNPNEFTILELAELVQSKLGGKIEFLKLPKDDPRQRRPDITLAKQLLNWEPRINLDTGIDRMIEYMRSVNAQ